MWVRTSTAALGSAAFFVVAPGTLVGLGPWLITQWEIPGSSPPLRLVLGVVFVVSGLIPPIHAFIQFVKAGGTPMPIAPTQRLVVTGFNRFVSNPMYVGLLTAILGQALLFDSLWLVLYAVIGWIATASFVHWYEEPTLVRTYGEQYDRIPPQCARVDSTPDALAWAQCAVRSRIRLNTGQIAISPIAVHRLLASDPPTHCGVCQPMRDIFAEVLPAQRGSTTLSLIAWRFDRLSSH